MLTFELSFLLSRCVCCIVCCGVVGLASFLYSSLLLFFLVPHVALRSLCQFASFCFTLPTRSAPGHCVAHLLVAQILPLCFDIAVGSCVPRCVCIFVSV